MEIAKRPKAQIKADGAPSLASVTDYGFSCARTLCKNLIQVTITRLHRSVAGPVGGPWYLSTKNLLFVFKLSYKQFATTAVSRRTYACSTQASYFGYRYHLDQIISLNRSAASHVSIAFARPMVLGTLPHVASCRQLHFYRWAGGYQ